MPVSSANVYGAPTAIAWQPTTSQIRPNIAVQQNTAHAAVHHSDAVMSFASGFATAPAITGNGGATTRSYPKNPPQARMGPGQAMTTHLGSYRP